MPMPAKEAAQYSSHVCSSSSLLTSPFLRTQNTAQVSGNSDSYAPSPVSEATNLVRQQPQRPALFKVFWLDLLQAARVQWEKQRDRESAGTTASGRAD